MAKRWYYKDANGNKVPVPQYKIDADDYYTKAMSDSRYYEKSATDTLLTDKVSKSDIVQSTGESTTAVMSQKAVSDKLSELDERTSDRVELDVTNSYELLENAYIYISGDTCFVNPSEYYNLHYWRLENCTIKYRIKGNVTNIATFDEVPHNNLNGRKIAQGNKDTIIEGVYDVVGEQYIAVCVYYNSFCQLIVVNKVPIDLKALKERTDENNKQIEEIKTNTDKLFVYADFEGFGEYEIEANGNIGPDGSIKSYDYTSYTKEIDAKDIKSIEYDIIGPNIDGYGTIVACYDSTHTFIREMSVNVRDTSVSKSWARKSGTIINDGSIAFVRFCRNNNLPNYYENDRLVVSKKVFFAEDYIALKEKLDKADRETHLWKGKKWYAFGTSITDNTYMDASHDGSSPTGKYTQFLNKYLEADLINCGRGGGSLSPMTNGNIMKAIDSIDFSDADLVTLEGFVNEGFCPIGTFEDIAKPSAQITTDTFVGSLFIGIKKIIDKAPNATVVVISDSQGKNVNNEETHDGGAWSIDSSSGKQYKFIEATRMVCRYMSVHFIDAGSKSYVNNLYPQYEIDHIHHTWLGGKQFAEAIWEDMKNIRPRITSITEEESHIINYPHK